MLTIESHPSAHLVVPLLLLLKGTLECYNPTTEMGRYFCESILSEYMDRGLLSPYLSAESPFIIATVLSPQFYYFIKDSTIRDNYLSYFQNAFEVMKSKILKRHMEMKTIIEKEKESMKSLLNALHTQYECHAEFSFESILNLKKYECWIKGEDLSEISIKKLIEESSIEKSKGGAPRKPSVKEFLKGYNQYREQELENDEKLDKDSIDIAPSLTIPNKDLTFIYNVEESYDRLRYSYASKEIEEKLVLVNMMNYYFPIQPSEAIVERCFRQCSVTISNSYCSTIKVGTVCQKALIKCNADKIYDLASNSPEWKK